MSKRENRRAAPVRDLVAGLFLSRFSTDVRRGWGATLALGAALATLTIALTKSFVAGPAPQLPPNDNHSVRSIELATTWLACGKYSYAFQGNSFGAFLTMTPESHELRLRDIPSLLAGSAERYCRLANQPWRNNENSLMLAVAAILVVHRDATLGDIGYLLRWMRIAVVVGVGLVMLRSGASFWMCLGIAYASVIVMAAVEETRFYSVYTFLPVLLTGFIAVLLLMLDARAYENLRRAAAASAVAGFCAAIAANFRSSYLPIFVACFVLAILFGTLAKRREAATRKTLLVSAVVQLLVFAIGFGLFQFIFIRPIDRLPSSYNLSYHVIVHPIVLGLALPPNRLARDEGIEWDDGVGFDLARRIDPGVTELNSRYEAALFTYYRQLWRERPWQMACLYWTKLGLAGSDIPKYSLPPVNGSFFTMALWPYSLVPHGAFRAVILSLLVFGPLFLIGRWGVTWSALVSMTAAVAVLLTLETALILTAFLITHEAAAMLYAVAAGLLFYQALIDGLAALIRRVWQPDRTSHATGELTP